MRSEHVAHSTALQGQADGLDVDYRQVDRVGLDRALEAVERKRMPEVREFQRLQGLPPRVGFNQAWWREPLRWIAALLLARLAIGACATANAAPLLFGHSNIKIRV